VAYVGVTKVADGGDVRLAWVEICVGLFDGVAGVEVGEIC
jgi:hypothetical protein